MHIYLACGNFGGFIWCYLRGYQHPAECWEGLGLCNSDGWEKEVFFGFYYLFRTENILFDSHGDKSAGIGLCEGNGWKKFFLFFLAFTILCRTDEIVFAFSGGKDSTVSLLLLLNSIPTIFQCLQYLKLFNDVWTSKLSTDSSNIWSVWVSRVVVNVSLQIHLCQIIWLTWSRAGALAFVEGRLCSIGSWRGCWCSPATLHTDCLL